MSRQERAVLLSWAVALGAGPALAVPPHGTLYIKAKNTHLKASSDPASSTLDILQPGREVTYEGREAGTAWCRVTVPRGNPKDKRGPQQGVIFQSNLSTSPPSSEVTSKNPLEPLSSEAFASSGAAIKAVGPGTLAYGKTLSREKSAEELESLVALAKEVQDAEVVKYAHDSGLPEVVGLPDPKDPKARPSGKGKR